MKGATIRWIRPQVENIFLGIRYNSLEILKNPTTQHNNRQVKESSSKSNSGSCKPTTAEGRKNSRCSTGSIETWWKHSQLLATICFWHSWAAYLHSMYECMLLKKVHLYVCRTYILIALTGKWKKDVDRRGEVAKQW